MDGAEPDAPRGRQFDSARLFPLLDSNRDRLLSKKEFESFVARGRGNYRDRPEVIDRIFERLDADRNGALSQEEFSGLPGLRQRARPPLTAPVTPKAGLSKLYKSAEGPREVKSEADLVLRDEERDKDLQLRITFPAEGGPFPVIVWSHGATGTKDNYQPIVRHWVSHGYVCIQANHSDSRAVTGEGDAGPLGANTFRDWDNRPKDIAFILDSLDTIEARVERLDGKMNKETIGVGGHSFGAHTAQLAAGTTTKSPSGARASHADQRPKAFVLISPQGKGPMLGEESWKKMARPAIVITGSNDLGRNGQPVEWRLHPFKYAPPQDKYLLFIEGAHHGFGGITGSVRYRNAGQDDPNHLAYVKSTTTAFWDAYLKEDGEARSFLRSDRIDSVSEGEAKLTVRATE
jgi:predicted dienelactone hydrolase